MCLLTGLPAERPLLAYVTNFQYSLLFRPRFFEYLNNIVMAPPCRHHERGSAILVFHIQIHPGLQSRYADF